MHIKYRIVALATLVFMTLAILLGIYLNQFGNVTVNYYSDVSTNNTGAVTLGYGPCETNKTRAGDEVTFVFTEPFTSLGDYKDSKIKKKIKTNTGTAKLFLKPGKYGLYMEDRDGEKRLYNNLKIDNAKNNTPIFDQGPWFVSMNYFRNVFSFKENLPC